jgi:Flp pilus assembly pilin Flp
MLVYAPIAGFIASLVITILYTNLKDYLKRRIMEMEVRRVEEE